MKIKKGLIKTISIIVLIVVVLGILFFLLLLPKYNQAVYDRGFTDGVVNVVQTQMQTGNIFIINEGAIEGIPLNVLCDLK